MAYRYEEATDDVRHLVQKLRSEYFPELTRARIKLLFDLKKRSSKNRLILARIIAPTDLLKYLTREEDKQIDYVISIDKHAWEILDEADRTRILRHELRHAFVEADSPEPFKLIDHTIQDFEEEMELNKDDPGWIKRVAATYNYNGGAAERARQPAALGTGHAFSLPRPFDYRRRTKHQPVAKSISDRPIKERLRPIRDVKGEKITSVYYLTRNNNLVNIADMNKFGLKTIVDRLDAANLQSWPPYEFIRRIAIERGAIAA